MDGRLHLTNDMRRERRRHRQIEGALDLSRLSDSIATQSSYGSTRRDMNANLATRFDEYSPPVASAYSQRPPVRSLEYPYLQVKHETLSPIDMCPDSDYSEPIHTDNGITSLLLQALQRLNTLKKEPKEETNTSSINSHDNIRSFQEIEQHSHNISDPFHAIDIVMNDKSDENFDSFRNRSLEKICKRNGGKLVISNPKMSRKRQKYSNIEGVSDTDGTSHTEVNSYWEMRKKNNDAAKKSRDRKRTKQIELSIRAADLELENIQLKNEIKLLKTQLSNELGDNQGNFIIC